MKSVSKSPDRNTFQKNSYISRQEKNDEPVSQEYLELFETMSQLQAAREADPEWAKNNLEYDLKSTDWILEKARSSEVYSQNLYAALCNNDFQKLEVMPLLKEETWSCSWRYAGGIIADMRQEGDYINWYCSGIRDSYEGGYVAESCVTDEIREDLKRLGWIVLDPTD